MYQRKLIFPEFLCLAWPQEIQRKSRLPSEVDFGYRRGSNEPIVLSHNDCQNIDFPKKLKFENCVYMLVRNGIPWVPGA